MQKDYYTLMSSSTGLKKPRPVYAELLGVTKETVKAEGCKNPLHQIPVSAETLNLSRSIPEQDMFFDNSFIAIFSERAFKAWSEYLPTGFHKIENVTINNKASDKKFYLMRPDIGPRVLFNYYEKNGYPQSESDQHRKLDGKSGWFGYSISENNNNSHIFLDSHSSSEVIHCDQKVVYAATKHKLKGLAFFHHSLKYHEEIKGLGSHYFDGLSWSEAYHLHKKNRKEVESLVRKMESLSVADDEFRPTLELLKFNAETSINLLEESYLSKQRKTIASSIISINSVGYLNIKKELIQSCRSPSRGQ